jgi:hypothetical protein
MKKIERVQTVMQSDWFDANEEIPMKDEVVCLMYIELRNEFERLRYYDIGYIFADHWREAKGHELVEVNDKKVLYWMEIPGLP